MTINIFENYCENNNINYKNNNFLDLIQYDYVIFLTSKFSSYYNYYLLKYFKKYNVLYFKYKEKDDILHSLSIFNLLIHSNNIHKFDLLNSLKIKKLKFIHFPENIIEPNTLYKKISFSNEEQFLPFNIYTIKKMEYKLRTFCQIAEKLGAQNITIHQEIKSSNYSSKSIGINLFKLGEASVDVKDIDIINSNIDFTFDYSNYYYNLNLNKFNLIRLIEEEKEFFITKEEFESDIDLKFLIDARCINLIKKYNTKIIIEKVNELERKIILKAKQYGLNIDYNKKKNYIYCLNINITFFNIYENYNCIDGSNIYSMKEGFEQLINILKKEMETKYDKYIYSKINNFFEAHIKSLIYLNLDKEHNYLQKYDIIKLNFKDDELINLYYLLFHNNLYYNNFKKLKNYILSDLNINYLKNHESIIKKYFINLQLSFFENILKNNNNLNDKLQFLCAQNHTLLYCIKYKLSLCKKNINEIKNNDDITIAEQCLLEKIILNALVDYFYTNISIKEFDIILTFIKKHMSKNNVSQKIYDNFFNNQYLLFCNILTDINLDSYTSEDDIYIDDTLTNIINIFFIFLIEQYYEISNTNEIYNFILSKNININYNYNIYRVIITWDEYSSIFKELYKLNLIKKKNIITNTQRNSLIELNSTQDKSQQLKIKSPTSKIDIPKNHTNCVIT